MFDLFFVEFDLVGFRFIWIVEEVFFEFVFIESGLDY